MCRNGQIRDWGVHRNGIGVGGILESKNPALGRTSGTNPPPPGSWAEFSSTWRPRTDPLSNCPLKCKHGLSLQKKMRGATWWSEPWRMPRSGPTVSRAQEDGPYMFPVFWHVCSYPITIRVPQIKQKSQRKLKETDPL